MKFSRGRMFNARVLLLLLALLAAWGLLQLSRADDPRFYLFLQTPAGRALARAFGWPVLSDRDLERPEDRWSSEERSVKYQWEKEIAESSPLHRIVLVNGDSMEGRIIRESADTIVFEQAHGDGGLTLTLARRRVSRIERVSKPAYRITQRDVRFRMEFPHHRFFKKPPYVFATDSSFDEVERAIAALDELLLQFRARFGELITRPALGSGIQVVFFSREEPFRSYQRKHAPDIDNATGFYSPRMDRLVILNAWSEAWRRDAIERLDQALDEYRAREGGTLNEPQVAAWRARAESRLRASAEEQTMATIRHEGAHQLFYTTGVHSRFRAENDWLVEGLAVYCETPVPGQTDPFRARLLKEEMRRGRLLALENLVNARDVSGLQSLGSNPLTADLAYSQAWALVRYLMEEPRRAAFFGYLEYLRTPRHVREVATQPAWRILCRQMGVAPDDLESAYRSYIAGL